MAERIPLDALTVDSAFQVRSGLDKAWVASLRAVLEESPDDIEPVLAYALPDGRVVLVDGFHRVAAARALRRTSILAEVREGSEIEAQDAGAEANAAARQKPLTHQERHRQVIEMAARHPEWKKGKGQRPGRVMEIARRLHMSHQAVGTILTTAEARVALHDAGVANVGDLSDRQARAVDQAPAPAQVALAAAATESKWSGDDTTEVAKALDEETMPLAHIAAEQGWSARETLAAINMVHEQGANAEAVIGALEQEETVPVVRDPHGKPAAYAETVQRIFKNAGPDTTKLLTALIKAFRVLAPHDPDDVAGQLSGDMTEYVRSALPDMLDYLERLHKRLRSGHLEILP